MNSQAKNLRQLSLSLPEMQPSYDAKGFVHSDANDAAWRIARSWRESEESVLVICGPTKSGKTHLAHLVTAGIDSCFMTPDQFVKGQELAPMIVVDNLPAPDPQDFLTALEQAVGRGARIVLAGAGHPSEWAMGLKDLRTRLEAMPRAVINEPDEPLIRAVIAKGFLDRQVMVNPSVVDYAAPRLPRTFAAAHQFVALADRSGLDQKRKISISLVQELVDTLSEDGVTA